MYKRRISLIDWFFIIYRPAFCDKKKKKKNENKKTVAEKKKRKRLYSVSVRNFHKTNSLEIVRRKIILLYLCEIMFFSAINHNWSKAGFVESCKIY